MTWFRIDDQFADHPRVIAAGNAAIGLWTKAGAWSMRHLTEGFIPVAAAKQLGTTGEIKKLVSVGLWLTVDGGYMFFRWAEDSNGQKRQETKEEAEKRRRASRERTAKWRGGKESKAVGDLPGDIAVTPPSRVSDASRDASVTPPSSSSSSSPSEGGARARQLPDDFVISEAMRSWAEEKVPGLDIDAAFEEWSTYWRGRGSTMKDWAQAWRNGMLKTDARGDYRRPVKRSLRDRYKDDLL